jgi:hypothetical protein
VVRRSVTGILLGFLVLLLAPNGALAEARSWEQLDVDRGVAIWVMPDETRPIPIFKGQLTIEAPLLHLLAILADLPRAGEWNSRFTGLRILQRSGDFDMRFYVRITAPWPISDRDGVMLTNVEGDPAGDHVTGWFRNVTDPTAGPVDGVVRLPRMIGVYRLWREGPNRTRVEYEIDADPGGSIPRWLARYVVKAMPVDALDGLRRQVARTQGSYDEFIRRHARP